MLRKVLPTFLLTITTNAFAQSPKLSEGISASVEVAGALSDGSHAPFWLTANQYGIRSVEPNSAYLRGGVFRSVDNDSTRKWDIGYGADLVVAANHTSTFFVQQMYADVRWLKGTLTIGQKQQPMQLKNNELSSGSQTFGINGRPFPAVRLALPNYWEIPLTKGFLSFKGHFGFGLFTDNNFQENVAKGYADYNLNTLMHTKAGYLRFGKKEKPLTVEVGLEMASQFGATHYAYSSKGYTTSKSNRNLASFWHAIIGGGADDIMDGAIRNNEGNMLGSWVGRINYDTKDATYGLYADHFFEDHSALFHLDYDGYANVNGKMVRSKNRYLLYPVKDIMLGADVHLKHFRWISDAVVEYIYTKYQSGPIYSDRNTAISDHIGGVDNYYNNGVEPGWVHWGQTLGNPLYQSPIYNDDHHLEFESNRFVAWHLGFSGQPTDDLHYRVRASWQESLGTYDQPFFDPKHNVSVGIEADYNAHLLYPGLHIGAAFGFDRGALMGNNTGGALTVKWNY